MVLRGGTAAAASGKSLSLLLPGGVTVTVPPSLQTNPGVGGPREGLQGLGFETSSMALFFLNQMVFLERVAVETQMAAEM